MNETLKLIETRRSVKKYKTQMPEQEAIDQIIKAGLCAASAKNAQTAIIIAVTDKKMRDRLSALNAKILGVTSDPFYNAPVVLVVLDKKASPNCAYDGSLVLGNLMLAAHSLGLGSCWINRAKEGFESNEGKEILKELGIEGEYEGVGHCVIGYIDGDYPKELPRKENRVIYVK